MDAERVKKGLKMCADAEVKDCIGCPYDCSVRNEKGEVIDVIADCVDAMSEEALDYIELLEEKVDQLEERVAIATECKHGRWNDVLGKPGHKKCSTCGTEIICTDIFHNPSDGPRFCYFCGSENKKEVQEDGKAVDP